MPDASPSPAAKAKPALPRWKLDSIYPGFDSPEYASAKARLASIARELSAHLDLVTDGSHRDSASFDSWFRALIDLKNASSSLDETLGSWCYAQYSADTTDRRAMSELNAIEEISVPFSALHARYLQIIGSRPELVRAIAASDPEIARYRNSLEDDLFWQTRVLAPAEEDLVADLSRSGASAWSRLQEQMTSTADCLWDAATGERKTLVELRALAYSPDKATRDKAFEKEIETCKAISIPVAAAINGVKGWSITMNERRHWEGDAQGAATNAASSAALAKSTRQGLISAKALDALILTMEESLPAWRQYLKAKAKLLAVDSCAFSDLFAPVGDNGREWSWDEARRTVTENFARFSPSMGAFAEKAFSQGWIDAEPRPGKIGGAYFTDMPDAKEGRVLCNFDGSFSSVLTVAHELGHAYHANVLKDEPALLRSTPMTLAETASIFAETVVFEDEMSRADDAAKIGLLEMHLQDGCQILVDILSRFYFERSLFERRKAGELSPDELCALMVDAQKKTYGDGLDPERLHPYMWLVKCHYYSESLAFYNFPYAFGQLFALALYARYRKEGPSFAAAYDRVLLDTGSMDAVAVTARAGFDIETQDFWRAGVGVFMEQIKEFRALVDARTTGASK